MKVLSNIEHPSDVAKLSEQDKEVLACELRDFIINTVARNGGHLASSLGVIELTLSLLNVFDLDNDNIIWDVGHQAYAWKILTGRRDNFYTLRKLGGISGFPNPSESKYDHFAVGHSSTSISAALGMSVANSLDDKDNHTIAIIGDGSLTGGMAFEALNQAGAMDKRLIVILNDNEMSISRNVGALSLFLSRNMSENWARKTKKKVVDFLRTIPTIGEDIAEFASKTQQTVKTLFTPGILFEAFNFNYIGPIDGHDMVELERHLKMAAEYDKPVLLHVLTTKGKGYEPAQNDPLRYHGLGSFDPEKGIVVAKRDNLTFTEAFSHTVCNLADNNDKLIVITAAMPEGTGTEAFNEKYPERFVDVGICEQHAITFAAGLAKKGYKPYVAIYSTFLQRAYDQIMHDVCLQNLPVVLCIDRAGLVGEDGATHHGVFDISYLRHMPNMHICSPRNEVELQNILYTAQNFNAPLAIRYPRGNAEGFSLDYNFKELPMTGEVLLQKNTMQDNSVLVMCVGSAVKPCLCAADEVDRNITVFDARWIKPLAKEQIIELIEKHDKILLVEEHILAGGFSSAVLELLADNDIYKKVKRIGIEDKFIEHGTQKELRELVGIDIKNIKSILETF